MQPSLRSHEAAVKSGWGGLAKNVLRFREDLSIFLHGLLGWGQITNNVLMRISTHSVCGVIDETRQIHTDYRNPVEEKG